MKESEIQLRIRETLNAMPGVRVFRNNVGVDTDRGIRYGLAPGSADLIGLVDGWFLALEVKSATGRVRPEQVAWSNAIRALGGYVAVVRSVAQAVAAVEECRAHARRP